MACNMSDLEWPTDLYRYNYTTWQDEELGLQLSTRDSVESVLQDVNKASQLVNSVPAHCRGRSVIQADQADAATDCARDLSFPFLYEIAG